MGLVVAISHVALHQLAFGDIMLPLPVEPDAKGFIRMEFTIEEDLTIGLRDALGRVFYDSVSCYNHRGHLSKIFFSTPHTLVVGDVVTISVLDDEWRCPKFAEDNDDGYSDEFS